MDKIWCRKSFEVGGHWPLWRGWKKRITTQNRQKSNTKKEKNNEHDATCMLHVLTLLLKRTVICLGGSA